MEIGKAITFFTEDPRWQQKVMIGTGVVLASMVLSVVLIGFVGFFIVAGYAVRLLQNVRDGQPNPLPEWDQWGDDLARGFKLTVVSLVWALPAIALVIPSMIGGALSESNSEGAQFVGVMISICAGCLTFLFSLLVAAVTPGFSIAFAEDERIGSGLQFRRILGWTQENIGQVIVVTLVYIVASLVLGLSGLVVGALLCGIGLIITLPLSTLATSVFQYHLFGQMAYAYPMNGGQRGPDTSVTPPSSMAAGIEYPPVAPPAAPESSAGETPQEPPAA